MSDSANRRVPFASALVVALGTSLLFMVFYGGAAYLTSLRTDVGTWYYPWERFIPFVPIMIVPYLSIDGFFFAAPFLCRGRDELRILAIRLTLVVIGAALAFLICPLQLAVERPVADGFFGSIYNAFTAMDRPYNLCPSMHIALRTVLAAHYGKHTRGWMRGLMNVWFFLIGCSTLMLYQHHFIDVVGGFVLAIAIMYVVDGRQWKTAIPAQPRLAACYAGMGGGLLLPMCVDPFWGWVVLWPAASCFCVAAGYAGLGTAVYRIDRGRLSWPAKVILGPVLLAQRISWMHYRRQADRMNRVADNVYIGRWSPTGLRSSMGEGAPEDAPPIVAVVNVCVAFDSPHTDGSATCLHLPILDLTAPTEDQIREAIEFIETHRRRGGVLVHCKAGYSRSAAIVAAWLVATGRAPTPDKAFEQLRLVRPQIVIRPEIASLRMDGLVAKDSVSPSMATMN